MLFWGILKDVMKSYHRRGIMIIGLIGILVFCVPGYVEALVVSSNIQTDTTWTLADSPIDIVPYLFLPLRSLPY